MRKTDLVIMTPARLRTIAKGLGVPVHLTTRKAVMIEAILDVVGRPFDREARDALHRTPVMLYEHDPLARNRQTRRWSRQKHNGVVVSKLIKRRFRRPAVMVPATARDLVHGRVAAFR